MKLDQCLWGSTPKPPSKSAIVSPVIDFAHPDMLTPAMDLGNSMHSSGLGMRLERMVTGGVADVRCRRANDVGRDKLAIEFGTHAAKESRDTELATNAGPARAAIDFFSLAALIGAFFIRAFVAQDQLVPVGAITLRTCFHADEAGVAVLGSDYLLG